MLDTFLEVACGHTKEAEARAKTVDLLKQLPNDYLYALATGKEKIAYDEEGSFLQKFKGSDLFEDAVALEQQALELRMQDQQNRKDESQRWRERDALQDQLSIQKKMLELELAKQQDASGEGPEEECDEEGSDADMPIEEGQTAPKEASTKPLSVKKAAVMMKAAYLSEDSKWLDKFKGTALFPQALELEEQMLQMEADDIAGREARSDERDSHYREMDKLRLAKRHLCLELMKKQEGISDSEGEEELVEEEEPLEEEILPPANEKEASARMKAALFKRAQVSAREKIASGCKAKDLTPMEKKAIGMAMVQGLKGMGNFMGATGKNVMQAASSGGGMKAVGQTLGGAGQMGAQSAGKWISKNPGAAAGIGAAGLGTAALGGAALS